MDLYHEPLRLLPNVLVKADARLGPELRIRSSFFCASIESVIYIYFCSLLAFLLSSLVDRTGVCRARAMGRAAFSLDAILGCHLWMHWLGLRLEAPHCTAAISLSLRVGFAPALEFVRHGARRKFAWSKDGAGTGNGATGGLALALATLRNTITSLKTS